MLSQLKILLALWAELQKKSSFLKNEVALRFEKELAKYLGVPYLLSVASGTDALILSLKALEIAPGDEIIVPSVSAFATAGAVKWVNATPIFVDVRLNDMNIDISKIEQAITPRTKAIMPVHLNGVMADMEKISDIAKRHSLFVIEDAAQAIGSKYKDKPIGFYGDIACLSFNPTKILGGYGDGGAVITKNEKLAEKIHMMRFYGAKPHEIHREHPMVGVSSRLNPLNATVLISKLPELPFLISHTRENYFFYQKALAETKKIELPQKYEKNCFINGHRFFILVKNRDPLLQKLKENGIAAYADHCVPLPYFPVLNSQNYKKEDFPIAEQIAQKAIFLPTHCETTRKQLEKTAEIINNFLQQN